MNKIRTYTLVVKTKGSADCNKIEAIVEYRLGGQNVNCVVSRLFTDSHEALVLVHTSLPASDIGTTLAVWMSETGLPPYPPYSLLWYR